VKARKELKAALSFMTKEDIEQYVTYMIEKITDQVMERAVSEIS